MHFYFIDKLNNILNNNLIKYIKKIKKTNYFKR